MTNAVNIAQSGSNNQTIITDLKARIETLEAK
jgi:hypothetical protein